MKQLCRAALKKEVKNYKTKDTGGKKRDEERGKGKR